MKSNYNQESFKKGQAFENYVEQVLFPDTVYDLLHKTNSYDQNSDRYVGDSRKPDFRFKSKLTGEEFHIEAKYRTSSYKDSYELLSETQITTFKEIHTKRIPIFIALGYGNVAHNPEYVSLIPYQEHKVQHISVNDAFKFRIEKKDVDPSYISSFRLNSSFEHKTNQPQEKQAAQKVVEPQKPRFTFLNFKKIGIVATFLLLAFILLNSISSNSDEKVMEERVRTYYELLDANRINELSDYISPDIYSWYDLKRPSFEEVKINIKTYRDKFPFTITEVDWDQFKVIKQQNGEFYATYPMEYKVKSAMNSPYKSYDLDIITVWDKDMKLVSASEVKR